MPPETSVHGRNADAFFAHLMSQIYLDDQSDVLLLCGDFNSRLGNENDVIAEIDGLPKRNAIDASKNSHGISLLEFLRDMKLCTLNGRLNCANDDFTSVSTRGSAVVDYVIVPHDCYKMFTHFSVERMSYLMSFHNLYPLISEHSRPPDHSVLNCTFECKQMYYDDHNSITDHTVNRIDVCESVSYKKYHVNNIPDNFMKNEDWKQNLLQMISELENLRMGQENVDQMYDKFSKTVLDEMDKFLNVKTLASGLKKKYKISKPYWTDELTCLFKNMCEKEKLYLRYRGSRQQKSRLCTDFLTAQNYFDKSLRKAKRIYNKKQIEHIEELNTNNPRDFWKHVKNLGPRAKSKIPTEVVIDSEIYTNPEKVLEHWRKEFHKLYNKPEENLDDQYLRMINEKIRLENENESNNEYINNRLDYQEVDNVIKKMKNNKAVGPDMIPYEILKQHDVKILCYKLFDKILEYSAMPSAWLLATITPVPKGAGKDPRVPLNYRGISLMSCVCKIYTSILNNRIINYGEEVGMFEDEQNGFRKKRSCTDHQFVLSSVIRNRLHLQKPTFLTFIDMQKAFDWIDRDLLMYKLLCNNINGKVYRSIRALYSNNKCSVNVNNSYTGWFPVSSGVRQGDSLSTTLFNLYVNDLVQEIKSLGRGVNCGNFQISILLYADDIVLVADNENNLQTMLDQCTAWTNKWKLAVNIDKTKVMHIRKKRNPVTNFTFRLKNADLEIVEEYKYLGLVFNEFYEMGKTVEFLSSSAGRALGAIIAKFRQYKDVGYNTFTKLYESCVKPILEYGSEIWGYKVFKSCGQIQQRAIRYFLGVHRFAPIAGLVGEMGWPDPTIRNRLNMLRYWNHLLTLDDTRLTKQVFLWDFSQANNNWSCDMFNVFESINLLELFWSKSPVDVTVCETIFNEQFTCKWKDEIASKPKLRTYIKFKEEPKREDYIFFPRLERSLLAQLRLGILPLKIETGRFVNLPLENRTCTLCDMIVLEDEAHFVTRCPLYEIHRSQLFQTAEQLDPNFNTLQDEQKLIFLLNSLPKALSKFLKIAWNKRQNELYNFH